MESYQNLCVQILDDVDRLVFEMKLLPVAVMIELLATVETKLAALKNNVKSQENLTLLSENEDDPSEFGDSCNDASDLEEEINIVVEENGKFVTIPEKEVDVLLQHNVENKVPSKVNPLKENEKQPHDHDRVPVLTFNCDKCSKKYGSKVGLLLHVQNKHPATVNDLLKCSYPDCNYTTRSNQLMRSHKQYHDKTALKKCPVCGKECVGGPQAFHNHMKLHTGEKNYKCSICDKLFVSQSRLTQHKANVHDPPKHQCHQCAKAFRSKVSYERHILTHSKEKPFSCPHCDYRARTTGNLSSHVKAVHGITNFTVGKQEKDSKQKKLFPKHSEELKTILGDQEVIFSHQKRVRDEESKHNIHGKSQNFQMRKEHMIHYNNSSEHDQEFTSEMLTLTSEKGEIIKAFISVEPDKLETVEDDGVVMEETRIVEDSSSHSDISPNSLTRHTLNVQSQHQHNKLIYEDSSIVYIVKS